MTAPLFWADAGALDGARPGSLLRLDGAEGRHAATVRRIGAGESVDLADGAGRVARCVVAVAGRDVLDLEVRAVQEVPRPAPRFVLVQALAKHGRDELAVESATEVGVDAVVPWQAERSVVVWRGARGEKSRAGWAETARTAAKQSRRPWIPEIEPALTTTELARRVADPAVSAAFVLHEAATARLSAATVPTGGDVLLVVGPEGGVSRRELDLLEGAGAQPVALGPEVLRSSTAGTAAVAVLAVRSGRW